jgi:hypothetical protein
LTVLAHPAAGRLSMDSVRRKMEKRRVHAKRQHHALKKMFARVKDRARSNQKYLAWMNIKIAKKFNL